MRILVLSQYYLPHLGGTERYIQGLYTELLRQHPEITVDLICYNTNQAAAFEIIAGIHVYRVPCWQILKDQFALPNYFALLRLLKTLNKKHSYHVVNSHNRLFDVSWWGWMVARGYKAKAVLTDHCASSPWHPNLLIKHLAQLIDRLLVRVLPNRYDQVIAVSNTTAKFLQPHTDRTIQVQKAGISTNPLLVKKNETNIKKSKVTVSYIGRMIESKHPLMLAKIAYKHFSNNDSVQFVFAGTGSQLEILKHFQSHNIKVLGEFSQQKVLQLLSTTDIFVLPSEHHEGIPVTLLEAGQSGCAVIATNQGGIPEVIQHERTGLIAELNEDAIHEAVERLIDFPGLRKKLAYNLQKLVLAEYNWRSSANKFYSLLP